MENSVPALCECFRSSTQQSDLCQQGLRVVFRAHASFEAYRIITDLTSTSVLLSANERLFRQASGPKSNLWSLGSLISREVQLRRDRSCCVCGYHRNLLSFFHFISNINSFYKVKNCGHSHMKFRSF